jgi:hypothetical protein
MRQLIRLTESDLHRIIKESIKSILYEDTRITYKGRVFDYKGDDNKEFKKLFAKFKAQVDAADAAERGEQLPQQQKPKRTRKKPQEAITTEQASPKALAANVKKLIYDKALKTIFVFVWHGDVSFKKEQINRIHALYTGLNKGENPLNKFNTIYRDIERRVDDIENWGNKNEHAVYNKVFELSYLLEDLNEVLTTLCKDTITLKQQGKFEEFKNVIDPETGEVIGVDDRPAVLYGRGGNREYGLLGLAFASPKSLDKVQTEIYKNIEVLRNISKNGRNPFDYDPENLRKKG